MGLWHFLTTPVPTLIKENKEKKKREEEQARSSKKWHITPDGPKACTADIRACPYHKHFNDLNDAMICYDTWQQDKAKYPHLKDEKILEPGYNYICNINQFKDTSWLSNPDECTPDSFAVLLTKNNNFERAVRSKLNGILADAFQQTNDFRRKSTSERDFYREGLVKEKDRDPLFIANQEMLANMQNHYKMTAPLSVSPDAEKLNHQGDVVAIFKYIQDKNPSAIDLTQALNYTIEDYYLDDNTPIRVFRHKVRKEQEDGTVS